MADFAPLRALLAEAGYAFVEPAIIHDASIFVDLAGEDLRRRLYLTSDMEGAELALRPDYTIPVCLRHLARGEHRRRADYAYLGPVFRQRGAVPGEFLQAGVESLGRADRLTADADILALALETTRTLGLDRPQTVVGDSALFHALLDALDLSAPWQRRLARAFGDKDRLAMVLGQARSGVKASRGGPRPDLRGRSRATVRRAVEVRLMNTGLALMDNRQADEIARRFVEKDALRKGIGKRATDVLTAFLAVRDAPPEALDAIRKLAKRHRLDIDAALERASRRFAAITKRGVPMEGVVFAAAFGRRLDYYTGFNFEIFARARDARPVVGGGRYDRLLSLLGAERTVPAVGFAIWLERTGGGA